MFEARAMPVAHIYLRQEKKGPSRPVNRRRDRAGRPAAMAALLGEEGEASRRDDGVVVVGAGYWVRLQSILVGPLPT
jgi:hypothetical protein